jgi:adenine/guanine phosphoribosyltransferase-like PRPP-binding protein
MTQTRDTYRVSICGLPRDLRLFEVAPGLRVAIFNILGDVEITRAAGAALSERLKPRTPDVIVTAEAKSIPLAYEVAAQLGLPYVVLRKSYKPYMGAALRAETLSITTGKSQTLYLDEKDHALVSGKRVAIVDDVISTGSTLQGMRLLLDKAGAQVVAEAAVFTEGERARWQEIIALGHLPLFTERG